MAKYRQEVEDYLLTKYVMGVSRYFTAVEITKATGLNYPDVLKTLVTMLGTGAVNKSPLKRSFQLNKSYVKNNYTILSGKKL